MRQRTVFAIAVFLAASVVSFAQERAQSPDPDILVRISYASSYAQICASISQDGNFRILSLRDSLTNPSLLKGKMGEDQLLHLKKTLAGLEARPLLPNHSNLIRDHAERFAAEISKIEFPPKFKLLDAPTTRPTTPPGSPHRVEWLNPDDQNPFPAPIAKLIDWMQGFQSKNAKPSDSSEFWTICPSVGLSYVQPSIAENHP